MKVLKNMLCLALALLMLASLAPMSLTAQASGSEPVRGGGFMPVEYTWDRIIENTDPDWEPTFSIKETVSKEILKAYCDAHGHTPIEGYYTDGQNPYSQHESYRSSDPDDIYCYYDRWTTHCALCGAELIQDKAGWSEHSYENGVCTKCGKKEPTLVGLSADDMTLYEGLDNKHYEEGVGTVEGIYDVEAYSAPYDTIHFRYSDGSERAISLSSLKWEEEPTYRIESDQTQEQPWGLGDHKATVYWKDQKADFTVHIVPTPVERIEVDGMTVYAGEEVQPWALSAWNPGIRIYWKDGTVTDTSKELLADPLYGSTDLLYDLLYLDHRYCEIPEVLEGPEDGTIAETGKTYPVKLRWFGVEFSFEIKAVPLPAITSFEIKDIELPPLEDVSWVTDYFSEYNNSIHYTYSLLKHLDITLCYQDGTSAHISGAELSDAPSFAMVELYQKLGFHFSLYTVKESEYTPGEYYNDYLQAFDYYVAPGKTVTMYADLNLWAPGGIDFQPTKASFRVRVGRLPGQPFDDVEVGSWYEDAVKWAAGEGITEGTSSSSFSPKKTCSRAEIVTFLWRAAGKQESDPALISKFRDVAVSKWYAPAVAWAIEYGVTNGTGASSFSPGKECNRAEIVTFLWRAAGKPDADPALSAKFTDVAENAWFTTAVAWAVDNGITKGTSDTSFSPKKTCTRAEAVTFLYRFAGSPELPANP